MSVNVSVFRNLTMTRGLCLLGRVIPKASATAGYVWSWTESNFHSEDPLTYEYTDPNHVPIYGLDHVDADTIVVMSVTTVKQIDLRKNEIVCHRWPRTNVCSWDFKNSCCRTACWT